MMNLEAAQAIADEAHGMLDWSGAPTAVRRAINTFHLLIAEHRTLRDNQRKLADTSNYALPGGQRE